MEILRYIHNYFKELARSNSQTEANSNNRIVSCLVLCSMHRVIYKYVIYFVACTKQIDRCSPAGAQSVATAATTKINGAIQVHEE